MSVLACDFNFNNHDLLTILQGTNVLERKKENLLGEIVIGMDPFWRVTENFWVTRWNSILELGLPSTERFWEKIDSITKIDFADFDPEILVIDTNMTLPLICPPLNKIENFDTLPKIEVYHLWSPSITLQVDEQERFIKAISILNRFSSGFEQRLTHIFTPRHYSTTSIIGAVSSFTSGEFNIVKEKKYKQSTAKPVMFNEIRDVLFANFLPKILNYDPGEDNRMEDLLKSWLENIISVLREREYKTSNVLIIPTVVSKIALLIEELTLKPRRTFETTRKDLGSLYQKIFEFVSEYKLTDYQNSIKSNS